MPIPQLLADALARDPARPLLTYYDRESGERVELSRATTANWVAKTANLLQDSLAAGTGTRVGIDLPAHWQRTVWLLACWEVGCVVELGADGGPYDVAVVGPSVSEGGDVPGADEVVALSLRPLGGRFTSPLPAGVTDYNAEVLGHGDRFAAYDAPTAETPALVGPDGRSLDHAWCVAAARDRARDLGAGARVLTDGGVTVTEVAESVLGPLAADGSIVLVTNARADQLGDLAADEHVTVTSMVDA